MQLILASSSRYRRELLERLQVPFEICVPDIDESAQPGESASALAQRLAIQKAQVIALKTPQAIVIGSDQVAACDTRLLGKPHTLDKAVEQLSYMQGKQVCFYTALALQQGEHSVSEVVLTTCQFRSLSRAQISAYLQREPALDVAGSAKIESLGIALMQSVQSDDPTALIGLPLIALTRLLLAFNYDPLTTTR